MLPVMGGIPLVPGISLVVGGDGRIRTAEQRFCRPPP